MHNRRGHRCVCVCVSYRNRWTVGIFTNFESAPRHTVSDAPCCHSGLSTTSELNYFLSMGLDPCPSVVLWSWWDSDTQHAHWSNITLSHIRVMDLLLEKRHQSPGVFSLNLISWRWVKAMLLSTASIRSEFMFSDSIHSETAQDEKLSSILSFTNEWPFSIFLPLTWKNVSPLFSSLPFSPLLLLSVGKYPFITVSLLMPMCVCRWSPICRDAVTSPVLNAWSLLIHLAYYPWCL